MGEESAIFIKRVFCTQVQLPFYPWCKVACNEKMAFGDNTEGDRKVNFSVNITFTVGIKSLLFPFSFLNITCFAFMKMGLNTVSHKIVCDI